MAESYKELEKYIGKYNAGARKQRVTEQLYTPMQVGLGKHNVARQCKPYRKANGERYNVGRNGGGEYKIVINRNIVLVQDVIVANEI